MSEEPEDVEIDAFLESDESVEDLLKEEYGPREPTDEFFKDLQPDDVELEDDDIDVSASPDEQLIKGRGIAFTDIDASDVRLDAELDKEEEVAATHGGSDTFDDPALNAVYKSTVSERAERERQLMDKRELLDLAGEIVEDYFRKHVKTDGIDEERLNRLKFAARRRVANTLAEE